MNNCIIVTATPDKDLVGVKTQTSSETNSSVGNCNDGVSTYVEGTIGYEIHRYLVE